MWKNINFLSCLTSISDKNFSFMNNQSYFWKIERCEMMPTSYLWLVFLRKWSFKGETGCWYAFYFTLQKVLRPFFFSHIIFCEFSLQFKTNLRPTCRSDLVCTNDPFKKISFLTSRISNYREPCLICTCKDKFIL